MFIAPMLLQTADAPFDSNDYLFELKNNGVRLLLDNTKGNINLYTRHGTCLNGRLPELEISLPNCYLDGELVCFRDGREDFEATMSRINSKSFRTIQKGAINVPLSYVVFDILAFEGELTVTLPLVERKEMLANLFEDSANLRHAISYKSTGNLLFSEIEKLELEGIVAKKANSIYEPDTRSYNWLKIINWRYYTCIITGYKKQGMGWLLQFETGKTAGVVEFGISPIQKQALYSIAKGLLKSENSQYYFIEPVIRCKVKGRGLLRSGNIMTPVFIDFIL